MTKVAIITGASGGLGQSLCRELESDGWQLALVGRSAARLTEVFGDQATCIEADVSTPDGASAAITACTDQLGLPSALAHCAGNTLISSLERTEVEQYRECLSANLDSAFFTLKAFVNALREAGQFGNAVLVSTVAAQIGVNHHEAISCAKAGIEGLVRSAAASYAPAGIRINAVAPGIMDTPANADLLSSDISREGAARQYPLPGVFDPAEVARLMGWLMSDQAARITGQVWAVDGGFSAIRPLVK